MKDVTLNPLGELTFAEELRHAHSVHPILDSEKEPVFEGDPVDFKKRHEAWLQSLIPKKKVDLGGVQVLEVQDAYDMMYRACLSKNPPVFNRPWWQAMNLPGDSTQQFAKFIQIKVPLFRWAAVWTQGTYFRLLVKVAPSICYSALSIGEDMTVENRVECYRALYDVGIKELINHVHKTNPHLKTMESMGHFKFKDKGEVVEGSKIFTERP